MQKDPGIFFIIKIFNLTKFGKLFFNCRQHKKMKLNKRIILIIISGAALIQTFIISYNAFTGFISVPSIVNLFERLLIGIFFTALIGIAIVAAELKIITMLDRLIPWTKNSFLRFVIEFFAVIIVAVLGAAIVTYSANIPFPYTEGVFRIFVKNSMIFIVVNGIIIGILEAIISFKRNEQFKLEAERLQKENAQFQFEMLKRQLNPHFLFNSLNVLSALVSSDAKKAESFIDEFSSVYRYTLDVIDKKVIELKEEIEFVKSYLFLQSIRFENAVNFEINIDAEKLEYFVPPLALQTLLENAFKHNKADLEHPLKISIFNENDYLIVINNLQPKSNFGTSNKVGLRNLEKRYKFLTGVAPSFSVTKNDYIAKIPIIKMD